MATARYALRMCAAAALGRAPGATRAATRNKLWLRCVASSADAAAQVSVVFGATGGIGSELVRMLAGSGGHVVAVGRDGAKLAALTADLGPGVSTVLCPDAAAPGAAESALAAAMEAHGRVDGVANCIGSVLLKPATSTTDAELASILSTNLGTSFSILRASVKAMTASGAPGGSVVLCSSAVARHGLANHEAIAAAKGAVAALTLSAAATYGAQNVRVNCVSPGLTRTPMTARITGNAAALKASTDMHALRRIGEPGDVARAIAFLLDPKNSFITGQNLGVDGGLGSVRPK